MAITAAMIKELRQRTGAGMMDCKKALTEAHVDMGKVDMGNVDMADVDMGKVMALAIENLRKQGAAVAHKKSARIAAEGVIVSAHDPSASVLVEVNSETDFVAKDISFQSFSKGVAQAVLINAPADNAPDNATDNEWLASINLENGQSVEAARQALIAKVGENIRVRRCARFDAQDGVVGCYLHGSKIGVLVKLSGGTEEGIKADVKASVKASVKELSRDIAMHIAASRPLCISEQEMDSRVLNKEKEIFIAQAEASGKPADIIAKMVGGRVKKFLKENTLLGQPFVKNADQTVGDLIADAGVSITQMVRFEVGEGIEKRTDDFVAEVMAQAMD